MLYLLAGHTPKGFNQDPGAVGNGHREADLTMELRDKISEILRAKSYPVYEDDDTMRLQAVLANVQSVEKDIVCDIHFNAGPAAATGVEVLIPSRSTDLERELASKLCSMLASVMRIRNRGVKTEGDSQHKVLGVMRELGINVLIEVCFISNATDVNSYIINKDKVASEIAILLAEFEDKMK